MQMELEISVQGNILPHIMSGLLDTQYINEKSAIYPDFFIHSCHIRDPFLKKYLFLSFPLLYFFFLQSFRRHLPPLLVFFPDVAQDFLVKDKAKGYLVVALFTSTKRVKTAKTQLDP